MNKCMNVHINSNMNISTKLTHFIVTTAIVFLGILEETLVQLRWQSHENDDDMNTKKDKTTLFIMCLILSPSSE